jgi:hypothetical protein
MQARRRFEGVSAEEVEAGDPETLTRLLKELHLSRTAFAELWGVDRVTVSRWTQVPRGVLLYLGLLASLQRLRDQSFTTLAYVVTQLARPPGSEED